MIAYRAMLDVPRELVRYWAAAHLPLSTLADSGYEGTGHGIYTPVKQPLDGRPLATDNQTYNNPVAVDALPQRTRLRFAHRPLEQPPPHHRQPPNTH